MRQVRFKLFLTETEFCTPGIGHGIDGRSFVNVPVMGSHQVRFPPPEESRISVCSEQLYRRALAEDPRRVVARHNLALLLAAQSGRKDEAIRLWRECIAAQPQFLPAQFSLAETLAASDRPAKAIAIYSAILDARPELISARV